MADCTRCGRKLPAFSFGSGGLCANCRQAEQDELQPGGHASQLISPWRTGPTVTMAIIGVNVAVFLAMVLNHVSITDPTTPDLKNWGADFGPFVFGLDHRAEPWRLLTSVFEHIGIVHILLNMWGLWNLGRLAEQVYDKSTYLGAYLLCGIGGSIACLWSDPGAVTAGASGAIFGIAGLLITTFWLGRLAMPEGRSQSLLRNLIVVVGYNLFIGASIPGISNSAHLGGFFTGLILGGFMAPRLTSDPRASQATRWLILAGAAVVLVFVFRFVKMQALGS